MLPQFQLSGEFKRKQVTVGANIIIIILMLFNCLFYMFALLWVSHGKYFQEHHISQ